MSTLTTKLPQLRLSANEAMWKAWHGAGLQKGTPSEVACIKNLVEVALPQVDKVWREILGKVGIAVRLQGVVCHGHPWVSYPGATRRCELGDFLLVHDHKLNASTLERRAVIVQAKVFHRSGVCAKNKVQLELYRRWPRFTYESWPGGIASLAALHASVGLTSPSHLLMQRELRITALPGKPASRDMLDDGCRHGMIDVEYSRWGDPLIGMNPWRLCSAQAPDVYTSKDGLTLGGYLVRLMDGQVGRSAPVTQWPPSLNGACHWSLMVMELLSILSSATASGSGNVAFIAATPNLSLVTGGRLSIMSAPEDDWDKEVFGIIHVQTGEIGEMRHED